MSSKPTRLRKTTPRLSLEITRDVKPKRKKSVKKVKPVKTQRTCEQVASAAQKRCVTMKSNGKTKSDKNCSETFEKALERCRAKRGMITITKIVTPVKKSSVVDSGITYQLPKSKVVANKNRYEDMQRMMEQLKLKK